MFNLQQTWGRHMKDTCLSVDLAQAHPDGSRTVNRRQSFYSWQLNFHTLRQNGINKAKLVGSKCITAGEVVFKLFLSHGTFFHTWKFTT